MRVAERIETVGHFIDGHQVPSAADRTFPAIDPSSGAAYYARAKAKLWSKVERLAKLPDLRISDFGTRRRHGFLWQRWCVEALKEGLGNALMESKPSCVCRVSHWCR